MNEDIKYALRIANRLPSRRRFATDGGVDIGAPSHEEEKARNRFLREELKVSAPQYDPSAGMMTGKQAALFGAGLLPGSGIASAAGKFPTAEGGFEPSLAEDLRNKEYLSAGLKGLGAAGDVASAVPVVGTALGSALKLPLATKMAMAMVPKASGAVKEAVELAKSRPAKAAKPSSVAQPVVKSAPPFVLSSTIQPGQAKSLANDTRVSTRFPLGVSKVGDALRDDLQIGSEHMSLSPEVFAHNMSLVSEYPGLSHTKGMSPEEAREAFLQHGTKNLVYLYNNSPKAIQQRSRLWYEGANRISDELAKRYGIPRQSMSASIAALSPQKDWNMNASLAERTADILFGDQAHKPMTRQMIKYAQRPSTKQDPNFILDNPANFDLYRQMKGASLHDLHGNPEAQAMWVRLYDEAHNPKAFRAITPEGEYGDFMRNANGKTRNVAWSSLDMIEKAIRSLQSGGHMDTISPLLGDKHKVRSFFNNIELPNDPRGDFTGDTHQVGATLLLPVSQKSPSVSHNFGVGLSKKDQPEGYRAAKNIKLHGVHGTYGLYADAGRRTAAELGMLPREVQSSTWEPVRELFKPEYKRSADADLIEKIWRAKDAGQITDDQARDAIFQSAGGIGTPEWAKLNFTPIDPRRGSTYR